MNNDFSLLKSELEDEQSRRALIQQALTKSNVEGQQWRSKYETESVAKAEELEEAKRRLGAKVAEAEDQVQQSLTKCSSLEKVKQRLTCKIGLIIL